MENLFMMMREELKFKFNKVRLSSFLLSTSLPIHIFVSVVPSAHPSGLNETESFAIEKARIDSRERIEIEKARIESRERERIAIVSRAESALRSRKPVSRAESASALRSRKPASREHTQNKVI
jgi:hypothetical protein